MSYVDVGVSTQAAGGPSGASGGTISAPFTVGSKGSLMQNIGWGIIFAAIAAAATWFIMNRKKSN